MTGYLHTLLWVGALMLPLGVAAQPLELPRWHLHFDVGAATASKATFEEEGQRSDLNSGTHRAGQYGVLYRIGASAWQVGILRSDYVPTQGTGLSVLGIEVGPVGATVMLARVRRSLRAGPLIAYVEGGGGITAGGWEEGGAGALRVGVEYPLLRWLHVRAEVAGVQANRTTAGAASVGAALAF